MAHADIYSAWVTWEGDGWVVTVWRDSVADTGRADMWGAPIVRTEKGPSVDRFEVACGVNPPLHDARAIDELSVVVERALRARHWRLTGDFTPTPMPLTNRVSTLVGRVRRTP